MIIYGFSKYVIDLVDSFYLSNRYRYVSFGNRCSDLLSINVGNTQGIKLGPLLWLLYVNNLDVDDFHCDKYADDTAFYKASLSHSEHDIEENAETLTYNTF